MPASPPLVFTHRLSSVPKEDPPGPEPRTPPITLVLTLTADERTKVRHYFEAQTSSQQEKSDHPSRLSLGQDDAPHALHHSPIQSPSPVQSYGVYLRLPRGTVLVHGDRLTTDDHAVTLGIIAKPEPVIRVAANTALELLKAAYHLGNRHVPLELTPKYLQFSPDPVLKQMMEHLGLTVIEAIAPFHPESGAYHKHHQSHKHQSHKHQSHKHQPHDHQAHDHQAHDHQPHDHQAHDHQAHDHDQPSQASTPAPSH